MKDYSERHFDVWTKVLRPPGGGIPAFSTGVGSELELQSKIYGTSNAQKIKDLWLKSLGKISKAKVIVIGVPLDTGAGIRRGAAYGPRAIRGELYKDKAFTKLVREGSVIDVGDIFVNPHFLHDESLNLLQIEKAQDAMYPNEAKRRELPVSALSQLEWVLGKFQEFSAKPFVLGGDHSVAWPVTKRLVQKHPLLAIVQPDAHTDLLESRLGVKYCFATWSFHANRLLAPGHLVQVGVRASGKEKAHWEKTLGVKQFWAKDIKKLGDKKAVGAIVEHLKSLGVQKIYFSNDIDGTDGKLVPATGTPEPQGPSAKFFLQLIKALRAEFEWVGADLVEVAPTLASKEDLRKTLKIAKDYALESILALF